MDDVKPTAPTRRRFERVLAGEKLDKPPIWLMRQAGRYLAEYRQVREKAGGFLDLCFNPALAAEVTLQPIRRFEFDAAILFADILLIPIAMGQKVWFEAGEGPRLSGLEKAEDVARLLASPDASMAVLDPIYETVGRVRSELPQACSLIGFAGAPWTVATYMIAGRGTKDQDPAKRFAYQNPTATDALLERLVDRTLDYLSAQIEAGADVIQVFDTWAGGLAPDLMERCVLGPTEALVANLKKRHPGVPIIGFPRGLGSWLPVYAERTKIDGLGLGTGEHLGTALKSLPMDLAVQGGLDPLALVAGGEILERNARAVLDATRNRPYIFNLGHGIVPDTPPENVAQLVEIVRQGS